MTHFDLGTYARAGTTSSTDAQEACNQRLIWLYGYNHEEAAACFERALEADPGCGMAHRGDAYAIGANCNEPWEFFDAEECAATLERAHKAIADARALKERLTPVENALIDALADRFPTDPTIEDYGPWNDDFSAEMELVYASHSDNLDVVTIYAEAQINRTP